MLPEMAEVTVAEDKVGRMNAFIRTCMMHVYMGLFTHLPANKTACNTCTAIPGLLRLPPP
jgi:hypothetical protein